MATTELEIQEETIPLIENKNEKEDQKKNQKLLLISFFLMIFVGLGNKIFFKLQMAPMVHYPFFLNVLTTFVYIPTSFAYILPMIAWGNQITKEQREIPLYKFAIMGVLDSIAGIMQIFAGDYIPSGALIILLQQTAIPVSMIITKIFLKTKYELENYIGATLVILGLLLVLIPKFIDPSLSHSGGAFTTIVLVWCIVNVLSSIPQCLSSVYKEKALGDTDIDVIYMNGWVAVFQFIATIPLAIPSVYATPGLTLPEMPKNFWEGMKCYVGINSQPDDDCALSPLFVNVYLAFNLAYNVLIIMILKYGSSNLLWLAMTFMVPLSNIAFSLSFVPQHQPMTKYDLIGLIIIMLGLVLYRFWGTLFPKLVNKFIDIKNSLFNKNLHTQY